MSAPAIALAVLAATLPVPQQVPLSGSVVDALNGDPVVGASVSIGGSGLTRTDDLGRFGVDAGSGNLDTLIIAHPDFRTARVALGEFRTSPPEMLVALTRRSAASTSEASRSAAAMAEDMGGSLWLREEFAIFETRAGHPLDLLFFAGLAGHTSDRADCVTLRGSDACAVIQIGDGSDPSQRVSGWAPADVEAFVVIPPGAPTLTGAALQTGLVALFLRGRDQ